MFEIERKEFIKELKLTKLNKDLFLRNKDDYYMGLEKAFDDAFNQYARRTKQKYKENKRDLIKPVAEVLYQYFNSEDETFDDCYKNCIDASKKILNNNLYGIAQKFTNMSFKYLCCYKDADDFRDKFAECHMPLDKYTIKWIKSLKNKKINESLSEINDSWTNMSEKLYNEIQGLADKTLKENNDYLISYNKNSTEQTCKLPQNKLFAEFIIWHQEKINEMHHQIKKSEKDFERLGIKWL